MTSGSGGRSNGKSSGDLLYAISLKLIWKKRTRVKLFFLDVYFSVLDTVYCRQKYTVARAFQQHTVEMLLSLLLTHLTLQKTYMDYFPCILLGIVRIFEALCGMVLKVKKTVKCLLSHNAFALCTMTVEYEELNSTKNYGNRKHCLMLLPGSLSSPNRRLTDVY
jgi:hypothetical protein